MCYSNCKNENFHGECVKRIDRTDTDLHCFEGFKCTGCNETFEEDENHKESGFCEDCFNSWELTECKECKAYFEKSEIDKKTGICPDCYEKLDKR